MKSGMIKFIVVWITVLGGVNNLSAQTRLILNGAKIRIYNGASLVLENPDTNAITRYSGMIYSEGADNNIRWYIGNNGTYIIPWGYDTSYLPLQFTKTSGSADGYISLSTYHTGWQNSQALPVGITKMLEVNTDNSAFVLDRFWKIEAGNYTTPPALSNLRFTYPETEYTASGNSINETGLGVYRWNDNLVSWYDFVPAESLNSINNTVTVSSVTASDLYKWWILADKSVVLSLDDIKFDLAVADKTIRLHWQKEPDGEIKDFEIQRSADGRRFNTIGKTLPVTGYLYNYGFTDTNPFDGKNYYRIKINHFNREARYSEIRIANLQGKEGFYFYPNPTTDHKINIQWKGMQKGNYLFQLFTADGKPVYKSYQHLTNEFFQLRFPAELIKGIYLLQVSSSGLNRQYLVFIN